MFTEFVCGKQHYGICFIINNIGNATRQHSVPIVYQNAVLLIHDRIDTHQYCKRNIITLLQTCFKTSGFIVCFWVFSRDIKSALNTTKSALSLGKLH